MQVITSRKKICTQQFWTEALIKLDTPNISFSEFHSSHKRSWKVNTERNASRADNSTSCLHIKKTTTTKHGIIILIVANRNTYSLSVVTAERSNFWHTRNLAAFYGQLTDYQSLYASTYYNVYRSITHAPGLSQSISLDSLLVTHLGYVQRNHVLIDIFTHWCGWRLIFRQEKDWGFFCLGLFIMFTSTHPP